MRTERDTELFVHQALWFASLLAVPTFGEFTRWIAPWLSSDGPRALEAQYRLNHATQKTAEDVLVELLSSRRNRASLRYELSEHCTRTTDWASTLVMAYHLPPVKFVQPTSTNVADRALLNGLATVSLQMAALLRVCHERVRAERLESAAKGYGFGVLTGAQVRRLSRDPTLDGRFSAVEQALTLPSMPLKDKRAQDALREMSHHLECNAHDDLRRRSDALEVSMILSIARAAQEVGWHVESARADQSSAKPKIRLRLGEFHCAIQKGRFDYPERLPATEHDRLRISWWGHGTRQPDVVLSFWHRDAPENVHFSIADAKRSEATNIVPYFSASVEAMAVYMVAFAGHLRSSLSERGFEAPLKPAATLFMYQELIDQSSWALHNDWLAALGLNHFGKFGPEGVWNSEQIKDWFRTLSQSAFENVGP